MGEEEEGTRLGPTLEFSALLAAELQKNDLDLNSGFLIQRSGHVAPGLPKLLFHPDFILVRIQDDTEAASESQGMGNGEKPPGWT